MPSSMEQLCLEVHCGLNVCSVQSLKTLESRNNWSKCSGAEVTGVILDDEGWFETWQPGQGGFQDLCNLWEGLL